ncbi:MAG: tRNA (adenosine(37)-N6)-dimethylallyltransferase MiaA [Deltaproteobacteria bacterium]|nr:tRNA (adenosine(37)-N6)-dimethylallyltransferase MiaA [Deltaproteobacteria bacterium]
MSLSFHKDFTDRPIFLLIAPTGAGKTELAIALAKKFNFEIINADAYQFFTMMDIGTAKPTLAQRSQAPHHLFDICRPDQPYSAHQFAAAAKDTACDIFARDRYPLLVGGSGFYARAFLTRTSDLPEGTVEGLDQTQAYKDIITQDPDLAKQLHPHDTYRIARAVFLLQQGIAPSQAWKLASKQQIANPYHIFSIDIQRERLYDRINQRSKDMLTQGLLTETRAIIDAYPKALQRLQKTIGYSQVLKYQSGQLNEDEMIMEIQQKTRNYAKRQMTWIRNQLAPKQATFDCAFDELSCYIEDLSL